MNVFISHSWTYSAHYERLAEWIFQTDWQVGGKSVYFIDTSVPRDNSIHNAPSASELKEAIYQRIRNSHVVVIPTGMYVNHSKWIQKEIDGARDYGKPIVAVDPWAQKRASSIVQEAATKIAGWNRESLVKAVWSAGNWL